MEFKASFDTLPGMMSYIRRQAKVYGLSSSLILRIELVCEEAIVNIISYAYRKKGGTLRIICEKRSERFEITIRDRGVAFNPIDVNINPQLGTPVHERKVGGMGIFLIRKIIDEVSYQREEKENILRLCFNTSLI